jgi:hypothetical protein
MACEPTLEPHIVLQNERVLVLSRCDSSPYADVRARYSDLWPGHSNRAIEFQSVRDRARLGLYEELIL